MHRGGGDVLYLCVSLVVSLLVALCLVSEIPTPTPYPHSGGTSSPRSHTAITPVPLGLSVLLKSHSELEGCSHFWQEALPAAPGFKHSLLLCRVQSVHLSYR